MESQVDFSVHFKKNDFQPLNAYINKNNRSTCILDASHWLLVSNNRVTNRYGASWILVDEVEEDSLNSYNSIGIAYTR